MAWTVDEHLPVRTGVFGRSGAHKNSHRRWRAQICGTSASMPAVLETQWCRSSECRLAPRVELQLLNADYPDKRNNGVGDR